MADDYIPNLDAYFVRIGWAGSRELSVETLHAISAHHAAAIPFENLDVLAGNGIRIAPETVERKLVYERRGGYCFEQNQLLLLVLRALGFDAKPLSARVRWMLPRDFIPPRTHLFVRVDLHGETWIVDGGVGGGSLTAAIRWQDGLVQFTPHDQRRIIREGEVWFHQVRWQADGDWFDVCEFTGEAMPPIDRELANWWTSAHPESRFRNNLLVGCAGLDGSRRTLFNREFTFRPRHAEAVKREIATRAELAQVLMNEFSLALPGEAQIGFLGLDD
jgi:N-hydroxyarylamine O-acetyltransferase